MTEAWTRYNQTIHDSYCYSMCRRRTKLADSFRSCFSWQLPWNLFSTLVFQHFLVLVSSHIMSHFQCHESWVMSHEKSSSFKPNRWHDSVSSSQRVHRRFSTQNELVSGIFFQLYSVNLAHWSWPSTLTSYASWHGPWRYTHHKRLM